MSQYTPPESSYQPTRETTHTREHALDDYEFELLVDGSYELEACRDLESRFILFMAGRLGLRRGEIAHLEEDWVNWRKQRIEIPEQEPCTNGRDGGRCGHCRQMADQKTEHALASAAEATAMYHSDIQEANARGVAALERELEKAANRVRLDEDEVLEITGDTTEYETAYDRVYEVYYEDLFEAILSEQWTAKTANASRDVPFSWNGRAEVVVDRYFDRWDEWMYAGQSINRRVNWLVSQVDDVEDVSPHVLRGTAATHLAAKGMDTLQMTNMFGWSQLSTSRDYIASSSEQLDNQLQLLLK